jgi:hypothetical protein
VRRTRRRGRASGTRTPGHGAAGPDTRDTGAARGLSAWDARERGAVGEQDRWVRGHGASGAGRAAGKGRGARGEPPPCADARGRGAAGAQGTRARNARKGKGRGGGGGEREGEGEGEGSSPRGPNPAITISKTLGTTGERERGCCAGEIK